MRAIIMPSSLLCKFGGSVGIVDVKTIRTLDLKQTAVSEHLPEKITTPRTHGILTTSPSLGKKKEKIRSVSVSRWFV